LIDRALRELGAYYVSEDWPGEDHWVIPAKRALRLAELAGTRPIGEDQPPDP
jgi:hypothetical protein